MVRWEHRYLLGTMVFTIAGDVVRDFDEEYEAWSWLEQEGWGLVAIEPPDPVRPGACKYYFKRQHLQSSTRAAGLQPAPAHEQKGKSINDYSGPLAFLTRSRAGHERRRDPLARE